MDAKTIGDRMVSIKANPESLSIDPGRTASLMNWPMVKSILRSGMSRGRNLEPYRL